MNFIMDESLGFIINRTAIAVKKEFTKRLKTLNLTPEQWSILNRLGEQDGLLQKDLAEKTYKDQPNTARILDKLEKKKLVRRADNPEDRRAFLIFLTDRGKEVRESIIPITTLLNEDAAAGLEKPEYNQLIKLLDKVYKNLS
ncbi:MAG: MarR family transcriptional regulator [Desulfuromonas sp.]|nr:MAG: MarR family transcriptional regulator [Desulfuromonas sp.]